MSLTLSGQLGLAQLGAAELGAFQTVTTGAGFPLFFPDIGPVKEATAPKKKRKKPKKAKKPKKSKRVKKPTRESVVQTAPQLTVTKDNVLQTAPQAPGSWVDIFTVPETLNKSVDTAAQRLRETITEEDELLLLIC